jgi:hypothetical protein
MVAPKRLKKPLQDHRVCYVKHLEFVNADHCEVFAELVSFCGDGILAFIFKLLIQFMLFFVNFKHELIVMQLPFPDGTQAIVELVHYEGLSTAWVSP